MRGKCRGVYLTCRHLSALVIWCWCWWDVGNLSHWWACSLSIVPFQLAWRLSPPWSERDDCLRIQHSGPAQQAPQCCSKEKASYASVDFNATVTIFLTNAFEMSLMPSTMPHRPAHTSAIWDACPFHLSSRIACWSKMRLRTQDLLKPRLNPGLHYSIGLAPKFQVLLSKSPFYHLWLLPSVLMAVRSCFVWG